MRAEVPAGWSAGVGRAPTERRLGGRLGAARRLGCMVWLILFLVLVVVVGGYVFRVPLLAKILGQSPDRVRGALGRRKR
jgi:hypothetical protein